MIRHLKHLPVIALILLQPLSGQAQKIHFPELTYNGKNLNELIVHRKDRSSIRPNDCVINMVMSLDLKDIDSTTVEGKVKDLEYGDPVYFAAIKITRMDGSIVTIQADATGRFIVRRGSPVKEILLMQVGYAKVRIKASGNKLF
ncbi:hypothetical protein ACE38W_15785 [Chitinophaga sp. Hz27]|uniref:hypothetical protein n=1 Tax=Chitinophaga sp. Hz27 TaxID=3347169 RepID=UPI0035E16C92